MPSRLQQQTLPAAASPISYQHKSSDSETGSDSTDFAISDASFNLYKVGQIPASGGATFEPVAPFTDSTAYPVDWSKMTGKDAQVWRDMANTLAGLIAVNKPDATATGGHQRFRTPDLHRTVRRLVPGRGPTALT